MHVGEIIHRVRRERRMTLVGLSSKSGVALATLSRIENGKMTGTIDSHMEICKALEISLPDLYRDLALSKKEVEVQARKARTEIFVRGRSTSTEVLATKISNKKMMPVLIKINRYGTTQKEETRAGVEKFIYILEGRVEAGIGNEKYVLAKGDTLYFDSSIPHHLRNAGTGEARLLSVICPPIL